MNSVKRFLAKMPWYNIETQEHPAGEFVLYSDYEKLLDQKAKSVDQYNSIIDTQLNVIYELKEKVQRLEEAAKSVDLAFRTADNGLIQTPHWVRHMALRDAVSHLYNLTKNGTN